MKGFFMDFLCTAHEFSSASFAQPFISQFLHFRFSHNGFFRSLSQRSKQAIQWVTSFAHFISVNGGGAGVTLASLLFNAVLAPFCKLTGVSRSASCTVYVINILAVTLLATTVKRWFFLPHSSKTAPTTANMTATTNNQTMGKRMLRARKEHGIGVKVLGMCVKLSHLWQVNAYVDRNEGGFVRWSKKKKGKDISSTQLSKGHTGDRFKLNKGKDSGFSIFWFLFVCCCISLFKNKFHIHLVVDSFNSIRFGPHAK